MDPVDKKKTVKYFFDTAPACRNERVKQVTLKILKIQKKLNGICSRAVFIVVGLPL